MKITEINIENFKSIKSAQLYPVDGINVFIGENSVGKSNIFDAINWLLGPFYPTFNSTKDEDHYLGNPENKIKIVIDFDDGATLSIDESKDKYQFSILNAGSRQANNEAREKYCCAYLGVDRQILDYLPSNRWSLLGRILQEINQLFVASEIVDADGVVTKTSDKFRGELEKLRDEFLFSVRDVGGNEIMKNFIRVLQEESAKQLNKSETDFQVDLNMYDPWNFYRTLQLIVHEPDIDLKFQASSLGMGVQASISIAILKAYSQIKLRNNTPIFIDEPELFLHPQAQRKFYKILREIADNGTQLFITTHSPNFLAVGHFDEIFLVRKNITKGTFICCADVDKFITDLRVRKDITTNKNGLLENYRNAYENTGDSQKANEAFFARKVVLVEGQSESLILPYFFELLDYDYVGEGVTIVRCGDKTELDRFYRLYNEFGIPCYIVFDGDKHLAETQEENENKKRNRDILSLFEINADYPDGVVNDKYLGFEIMLEKNLGFEVGNNVKALKLFTRVKENIKTKEQVPQWVSQVVEKLRTIPEDTISILLPEEVNQEEDDDDENDLPF